MSSYPDDELQAAPATAAPLTAKEDKQYAFMAHCFGVLGFLPSLLIFLIFRRRGPFTAQESKEALNFTLPLSLLIIACSVLLFIYPSIGGAFALAAVLIWLYLSFFSLRAAVVVQRGNPYRYPLTIRFVR